jgi:TonB family protein
VDTTLLKETLTKVRRLPCLVILITSATLAQQNPFSTLTIQQARERVHQLDQETNRRIASEPPLAPRGTQESTIDFDQRRRAYEDQIGISLLGVEIRQLRAATYDAKIQEASTFKTYDPDTQILTLTLAKKDLSYSVPPADAKQMRESWTGIAFGWRYSENDAAPDVPPTVLVWDGHTYMLKMSSTDVVRSGTSSIDTTAPRCTPSVPVYSEEALKAHIQGTVILDSIIHSDGTIEMLEVVQSLGYGLDEEAIKSLKSWKCLPGKLNDQPVSVRIKIQINFRVPR